MPCSPSSSGRSVIAVLSLPLPRLTRCGLSVCTFSPFPVSIRSSGPFCRQIGWKVRFKDSRLGPEHPTPSHTNTWPSPKSSEVAESLSTKVLCGALLHPILLTSESGPLALPAGFISSLCSITPLFIKTETRREHST